jgi:peptidoglycan/xylan/chitin deacetylase (PgdA/CDA1 family)
LIIQRHYAAWWLLAWFTAFTGILALGSIFIQWNFYLPSVNQLNFDLKNKTVALTFDDGPTDTTEQILAILQKENVQATFFLIGKNIDGKEHVVRRMYAEGHAIGNHSFNHGFNFDWQSAASMAKEIQQTNKAIEAITHANTTIFRPPYGVTNPNVARAVKRCAVQSIGWNIRSMDTIAKSEEELLQNILKQLKPNAIILLHDRCPITLKILPRLICEIKKQGYVFATL